MGKEQKKKEKSVNLWAALKSNCYMLRISFQACPGRVTGAFAVRLVQHLNGVFSSVIFWEVLLGYVERDASFWEVVPFLLLSIVFYLGVFFGFSYFDYLTDAVGNQKLYEKLHVRMFQKAADCELECFENPEFYNKYMKAATQIFCSSLGWVYRTE